MAEPEQGARERAKSKKAADIEPEPELKPEPPPKEEDVAVPATTTKQEEEDDEMEDEGDRVDHKTTLAAVVTEKDLVHQENSLLSDHLMRLMMRSGSMDNNSTQAQLLDSLEELDEVYDELEESQVDYPRGRTSSSRMSYNNNAGSPSSSIANNNHNRASWMKSAHEIAHGLSLEEKCDVAILECKAIQDQMNIYRQESERILDELQAAYDEAELRTGEIRRDLADFQREVMQDAALRVGKKAISEKVLKFLNQKIKDTRSTILKLRDRNATLHANIAKTEASLETKKSLSDVLHAVDFDQLSIQKQQMENRLRDREKELHRIKATNLKTITALEKAEAEVKLLSEEDRILCATIIERKPQVVRVAADISQAQEQKAKLQEMLSEFIKERKSSTGEKKPAVIDYMGLKKEFADLEKEAHVWQNKVEVAQLTLNQMSLKINILQRKQAQSSLSQTSR